MLPAERQWRILTALRTKHSISVAELREELLIGEATIRRDLDKLEEQGLLKRSYGGAVAIDGIAAEVPLTLREFDQREEKDHIGRVAARLVEDGDTVVLDSSSTCLTMVPYLKHIRNLTVITNGAKTTVELGKYRNIHVYSTGGIMRDDSFSLIGDKARDFIKDYYVDKVFFSARAISREIGILFSNQFEAELRKVMIQNSKFVCLLVDHTRFDSSSFYLLSRFERINAVVSDKDASPEWKKFFLEKGIAFYSETGQFGPSLPDSTPV